MIDPLRVRMTGPLVPFKVGFAAELARQGYTPNSARQLLRLAADLSRWLAGEGLGAGDLSPVVVERFFAVSPAAGHSNHRTSKALEPLLAYLRGQGAAPPEPAPAPEGPVEELLWRYRRYLTVERGLTPETSRGYVEAVRPFLSGRLSAEGLDLGRLRPADVTAFVVARCPHQARGAAKLTVTALRSLLGFLHLEGEVGQPLARAVPSVAGWRLAGLPRRLGSEEVARLLASCDRDTANGRRDFAILTTLTRLGLRAGEVATLGLDDIDWRAGEILVRGKGRRTERLPLPAEVGEAITAYLRNGRPASAEGRAVFVRVVAPHRVLSAGGVTQVVAAAARRAGLGVLHAHSLRHTAASELLRGGASLAEVGQVLRHRRAATTAIYAKVDREALRAIVRPWPGAAR